jgi:asparagine synthase (glutamine-hydrolysing)
VILAGYEEWGINVIDRMRGQFAFALFDGRRRRLFLVRDRMGEKPLKYFWDGKTMVFASELKAILTQPEVVKEVNWKGVHQYLTYGYVPAPMTSFVGIKKLEPAHLVELNMVSGKLTKTRYWDVDFSKKLKLSENEWGERLRAGFEEATKLQMVADVPVGAFLSGGVDSSALVAMMAKSTKERVITFSIGFKDATHDETKYAKQIGKLFNTDHEVIRVNPWQVKSLLEMVEHFEELLANSSLLISYLVSKQARKKVTVVLTGDGGDENFSGYLKHQKLARDLWFDYYKQPTT